MNPMRQLLGLATTDTGSDPVVRMSDINHSITEILNEDQETDEVLSEELNDLDFKRFVADLSGNACEADTMSSETPSKATSPPRSRIIYERVDNKETIIIDNITNRNSDHVHVVKVQITLPSGLRKPAISTLRARKCIHRESRGGHHLPVMGKAALMSKLRSSKGRDSEIVRDLVTQRFQNFLKTYHEKSFHRQSSRLTRIAKPELDSVDDLQQDMTRSSSTLNETSFSFSSQKDSSMSSTSLNDPNRNNSSKQETEDFVEYDAAQFLKDALGDEIFNHRSTDVSAVQNNSIGTSNISTLISTTSRYEQVTYNSAIYEASQDTCEYVLYPNDGKISDLLLQSDTQNMIIVQIAKALAFCKITKEFSGSTEELEAERVLLVATCKRNAIQDEIRRLANKEMRTSETNGRGSLLIRSIVLPPRQRNPLLVKMLDKKRTKMMRDFSDWYLCIASHGVEVFASRPMQPDKDGFLHFDDEMRFDNLRADFVICLEVYVMKVRNPVRPMSHESKFHLNNDKTRMCPLSPPKLFCSNREMKNVRIPQDVHQKSSYKLGGRFYLKIEDIGHLGHFKLAHFSLMHLQNSFIMDFRSSVLVNEDYSGFLDVCLPGKDALLWNRRWCSLTGPVLAYYNCPGEETPLGLIDLQYCPCGRISMAERRICARPRTLMVKISKNAHILQYFLAADSKQYMEMWENKLNATLETLRAWNALKSSYPEPKGQ